MTLSRAIEIIEGLTGKEVTSIRWVERKVGVYYRVDFGDEHYLLLN
jgi:hypothetical protein